MQNGHVGLDIPAQQLHSSIFKAKKDRKQLLEVSEMLYAAQSRILMPPHLQCCAYGQARGREAALLRSARWPTLGLAVHPRQAGLGQFYEQELPGNSTASW